MSHAMSVSHRPASWRDSFVRANNALTPGAAESGHAYTVEQGTAGISGNRLYFPSNGSGDRVTMRGVGSPNMRIDTTLGYVANGSGTQGVIFAGIDALNYLIATIDSSNGVRIFAVSAGAFGTALAASSGGIASGNDYAFTVIKRGGLIHIYLDGRLKLNFTLTGANLTKFTAANAVRIGLRGNGAAGVRFGATTARVSTRNDFTVYVLRGIGQSITQGVAIDGGSTVVPPTEAFTYSSSTTTLMPLVDPVGTAANGSVWPAFGLAFHRASGKHPVVLNSGVGGSALVAVADVGNGSWGAAGALHAPTPTSSTALIATLQARGLIVVYAGTVFDQGHREAVSLDAGLVGLTDVMWENELLALIARERAVFGATMPFFITPLGRPLSGDTAGFQAIYAAAARVVASSPYNHWTTPDRNVDVFSNAARMKDEYHPNQIGNNILGAREGAGVAAVLGRAA